MLHHGMRRINLGCGPGATPGWLNCDRLAAPGVDLRYDVRAGVPLATQSVDCIAAIHLLQDLALPEIAPLLADMHRVLKPGGVLRVSVPDLDRALRAYLAGDARYFYVPDADARSIGAKLITQIIWYGSVRTPCTYDFLAEWLAAAGFAEIERVTFGASRMDGLAALDNRERESLFIEAVKTNGGASYRDITAS